MRSGPMSPNAHSAAEPLIALILIASPWIFGFSDVDTATGLAVGIGVAVLVGGMLTRWRFSLAKIIPLEVHFAWDLGIAALLILSPFIFGFGDEGGAARFFVIAGVLEAIAALATRWDPAEAGEHDAHPHRTVTTH